MRTVTCQGDEPLPQGFDEATVAAYCKKQQKAIAAYRDRYLPVAGPFLARLRPAGTPTTVVYPFGGGDLVSALTTYPDARDLTTLSLEHAGDPRRLSAIKSTAQLADSLELIRATSAGLLYSSDSKTENLMKGQRGELPGQLSFFLIALAVHGYEPVSLRYVRVEADGSLHGISQQVDILVALNGESIALHRKELVKGGVIVYDGEKIKDVAGNGDLLSVPLERLAGEAGDWCQLDSAGMSLSVHRDRRHKRHLVFRATSGLTAAALAAEVGVVHLHRTGQPVTVFAFGHSLHQLVMDQPGRGVTDAQMSL